MRTHTYIHTEKCCINTNTCCIHMSNLNTHICAICVRSPVRGVWHTARHLLHMADNRARLFVVSSIGGRGAHVVFSLVCTIPFAVICTFCIYLLILCCEIISKPFMAAGTFAPKNIVVWLLQPAVTVTICSNNVWAVASNKIFTPLW